MQPNQTQLDPQALMMAKAIRQVESNNNPAAKGGSGEYGYYQFTPGTWDALSQKYLGKKIDLTQATPEQQNQVAYSQILDWKNQGYNVGQVASMWNAGRGNPNVYLTGNKGVNSSGVAYDTQDYAMKVANAYQTLKSTTQQPNQIGSFIPTANADVPGVTPQASKSVGGFVQNVFNSAGNLVSGVASAVTHPVQTISNIVGMAAGGVEKAFGVQNEDTQKFDNLVGYLKQRYGGDSIGEVVGHIANTAYTDPVGMALDLSTLVDGVGAAVGAVGKTAKIAELAKAADIIKSASDTINPIAQGAKIAVKPIQMGANVTRSVASHLFSLSDPASITRVLEDPGLFSKSNMSEVNRISLAEDFGQALDQLHNAVQEGGKAYGTISSGSQIIKAPENWIQDVLTKGTSSTEGGGKAIPFKLDVKTDPDGNLTVGANTTSFTRDPRDIAAIQNFVNTWGNKTDFTPQEFLNMRSDLAKMSKFGRDIGKNDAAEIISRALRADANKMMRPQINGLKELDETQAPIIRQYSQAKKDFLTIGADNAYEFKPGAINKIANATGKGKDILLQRMEQIAPGITKRIQILKAIEDWESASHAKVGAYSRGILEGGGLLTGSIPAIAAAIVSNPAIALPLLRGLGWSTAKMKPLLDLLKKVVNTRTLKYPAEAGTISNNTNQLPQ